MCFFSELPVGGEGHGKALALWATKRKNWLYSESRKLFLGAKGIATRNKKLLGALGLTTRSKKLLGATSRFQLLLT